MSANNFNSQHLLSVRPVKISATSGTDGDDNDQTKVMETGEAGERQRREGEESDDSDDTIELNPQIQVIMAEFSVGVEEAEEIYERYGRSMKEVFGAFFQQQRIEEEERLRRVQEEVEEARRSEERRLAEQQQKEEDERFRIAEELINRQAAIKAEMEAEREEESRKRKEKRSAKKKVKLEPAVRVKTEPSIFARALIPPSSPSASLPSEDIDATRRRTTTTTEEKTVKVEKGAADFEDEVDGLQLEDFDEVDAPDTASTVASASASSGEIPKIECWRDGVKLRRWAFIAGKTHQSSR